MPPTSYYRFHTEWAGLGSAFARSWPSRGSIIPNFMVGVTPARLEIDPNKRWQGAMGSLAQELFYLEQEIKASGKKLPWHMNALAQILARVDQMISFQKSAGPRDPRQQFPQGAWKIPVRRISSHYFQGWNVRRIAPGTWMVYNPTREAYYIEYGIHTSGRRVRRPISKLALIATLKFADTHRIGQFVWEGVFGHMRTRGINYRRGAIVVNSQVQSPGVMRFMPTNLGGIP